MHSDNASLKLLKNAKKYSEEGHPNKALLILNDILEGNEQSTEILSECYFQLANIAHTRGEIGKAIKAFSKSIELNPSHTDASLCLSVLYNDIGHYEDAKKIFQKTDRRVKNSSQEGIDDEHIRKKFALKHYELAELYLSYNRIEEALFEYNKSIALDEKNLDVRVKVAKVYAKKKFISKAFDELKRIKNEHPGYLPARIHLGVLYYGCGKILEAQAEWQKILAREPGHPEAAMYLNLSQTASEISL